jgi:XrtJ-associated TM-motif-TM protein
MTRKNLVLFPAIFFFSALAMHAQGGCSDSPEAPTDILMLVGATGLYFGHRLRGRFMAKKNVGQK